MTPEPNRELIHSLMTGYQRTAALRAALDLRIFTAIGEGATSVEALSALCQAAPRGIRILCDYLVILGLLEKENAQYRMTLDSALLLDERSADYVGGMVQFLNAPRFWEAAIHFTETVRQGHSTLGDGIAGDEAEEWVAFARHMQPMAVGQAKFIADMIAGESSPQRVLDVAAGHGLYGIAVAQRAPKAVIVAQDWPKVLAVAEDNARELGVSERYRLLPGSAFAVDFGTGFDLALVTNFLHHFDEATCTGFLRKLHAAMTPAGRLVVLEFVPNEDRVTPARAAAFSLNMLLQTRTGDAYTERELFRMLTAAGFTSHTVVGVPNSPEKAVVTHVT